MIYKISSVLILLILPLVIYLYTLITTKKKILSIERIPKSEYALVLGAGLRLDGSPTDLLLDRILTSLRALETRKIGKIIFSGAINQKGFSEPQAMQDIAKAKGINPTRIITDCKGNSTFDSCLNFLRSRYPHPVILVTQPFHLHRSLLICNLLGLDAYGLPATGINHSILNQIWWHIRECYAIPYNLLKFVLISNR